MIFLNNANFLIERGQYYFQYISHFTKKKKYTKNLNKIIPFLPIFLYYTTKQHSYELI